MVAPRTIERRPAPPRSALRRALGSGPWLGLVVPVLLVLAWELGSALGTVDARFLPRPTRVVATGADLLGTGALADAIFATVRRLLLGTGLGIAGGVLAGFFLGLSTTLRALLEPLLNALYTVPKLALLPLLLLVFGTGEIPLVALVAITVFFYMWMASMQAVMTLDRGYGDAAAVFGASWLQRLRHVVVPAVLPQLFASMRISFGVGVLVVVGAEFVNASEGLGAMVWQSWSVFLADRMYVGIVTISLIGVGGMWVVQAIGEVLTPWTSGPRARPRRLIVAALAVVLLAGGLAGSATRRPTADESAIASLYRREAESFAPRPLAERRLLRVSVPGRVAFVSPILLADAMGEFARENLDVQIVLAADVDSYAPLAQGELDAVTGAPSAGFFNAVASGLPIRWATGLTGGSSGPEGIYVRRAVLSDPEQPTWRELEGRTVGSVQGTGGALSYVIARQMLEAGADPRRVRYERLRSSQDIGIALRQGAIDAGWLSVPLASEAAENPDLAYLGGLQADDKLGAIFFGPSLTERDREAGTAFVRALARTIDRYLALGWYDDDETVAAVAELTDSPPELLRETAQRFDLDLPGPRALHRVQHVLAVYPDILAAPTPLPDARVVDRGFVERVFDEETTFAGE